MTDNLDLYQVAFRALETDNPRAPLAVLKTTAFWLVQHFEGTANVKKYGAHVLHPKTGAPIENPWISILIKTDKILNGKKLAKLKIDGAFSAVEYRQALAAADARRMELEIMRERRREDVTVEVEDE